MQILIRNLTNEIRTIALPVDETRTFSRTFGPHEVLDWGTKISPYVLNLSSANQLQALVNQGKVSIDVVQQPSDFTNNIGPTNPPTPPLPPGNVVLEQVTITYQSPPYQVLQNLTVGQVITSASFVVTIPFDGSASVQLGTPLSPGLIFGINESQLGQIGQYTNDTYQVFGSSDLLQLSLSSGGSSQGAATLFYWHT